MKKLLISTCIVLTGQLASAQVVNIIDGGVAACSGTLVDSGGEGGPGYGPNEDFTLILCADAPGNAIRLDWTSFNLGPDDQIEIFDGPSVDSPSFGVLNSAIGGVPVQSSYENTQANGQGCLTLHFMSGASGAGSFTATISCFVPCAPPTASAVIVGSAVPAMVCVGEEVTFDGSASVGAPGFSISSYSWEFQDGTSPGSGSTASHAFAEPGEFNVALTVTDNNNCENTNVVDIRVRVNTIPSFPNLTVSDTSICQGEEVTLSGAVFSPTWTNIPQPFVEGLTELPDGSGITYNSQVAVNGFPPGTQITTAEDVSSVCLVMEHSFMGDLIVTLTSPGGQEVLLFDGNPGGGIYLGGANNNDDLTPGEGWLYCFQTTAAWGTLPDEAVAGNTVEAGTNPPDAAMVSGTYTSQESFGGFAGSGVNGTWTLDILDDAFIDDGFIFEWYINFNPSLYPDNVSFTPVYGAGADSTYWTGPGIVTIDANADQAVVAPTSLGANAYTYTAINDFGCTFDTTITIEVVQGIPSPLSIAGDDEICTGSVSQLSAPTGYTSYEWSNGYQGQSISTGPGTYTVTVFSGDCSLESEPFTVTGLPSPAPVIEGPGFSCGGTPATLSTALPYSNYNWSTGASTPTVTVGTGSYSVTVTENGCSGTSAPFSVTVGSDPQALFSMDIPSPQGLGATVEFDGTASQGNGSPIAQYEWNFGTSGTTNGAIASNTFTTPGSYGIQLVITAADGCQDSISFNYVITPEALIIPNVFTPNNDSRNETFEIVNGQYFNNSLAVYDRWGKVVFEKKNYQNTWKGTDVPDGTYYFVFKTEDDNKEYTGHVTILR